MSRVTAAIAILFAAALLTPWQVDGQVRTGSVTGIVRNADTGEPLPDASVRVVGGTRVVEPNAEGRFVLLDVPAGRVRLRVAHFGFETEEIVVSVSAGESAQVEFLLQPAPFGLDEMVVTATGQERQLRELGNQISTIDMGEVVGKGGVTDLHTSLLGRVAGVSVLPGTGTVGSTSRIRIRGISSPSLSNEPLVYVDGIRVESSRPPLMGTLFAGSPVSLLDNLNPEDIESIEVVKGPSAATLYGTQATNGVILIQTKKGRRGAARWSGYVETGFRQDRVDYPQLYFSEGVDGQGSRRQCLPRDQAAGLCQITELHVSDPIRDASTTPFDTGLQQQYGLQVQGGSENTLYFLGAEFESTDGVYRLPPSEETLARSEWGIDEIPENIERPNGNERISLRANVTTRPVESLESVVSVGWLQDDLVIAPFGFRGLGMWLWGNADPEEVTPYEIPGAFSPRHAWAHVMQREANRLTGSTRLTWTPTDFVQARAVVGTDYLQYDDHTELIRGRTPPALPFRNRGFRQIDRWTNQRTTVELGATASYELAEGVTTETSAGAQYVLDQMHGTQAFAQDLAPGGATIAFGAQTSVSEQSSTVKTLGGYLQQQVNFNDRLYFTAALRADRNSAFGADFATAYYPKASFSWVAREDGEGTLNALRLRGAIGESGLQPEPNAAVRFFSPITGTLGSSDVPAVTLGGLGNEELKPERSREIELGADASFFANRVDVELTVYDKTTTDLLIERDIAPSLGAGISQTVNLGKVVNRGIEVSVNALVLENETLQWRVGANAFGNRNRLEDLGGAPPIRGFGWQNREGYPLFGYWHRDLISFEDTNGDGIIVPDETVVTDTMVFKGSSVPTRGVSLTTDLSFLGGQLEVGGLVDYKGGHVTFNNDAGRRCTIVVNCRAVNDPSTPLAEQAKVAVGRTHRGVFMEPGWFIKFREAYVRYRISDEWLTPLRLQGTTFTVTGRNLGSIFDDEFTGWDPELTTPFGGPPEGGENFGQPGFPLQVTFRLDFSF